MVLFPIPIDRVPDIKPKETDNVAGGANVAPTYLVSDVHRPDEITPVSADSTTVSATSSSPSSINTTDTAPNYSVPPKRNKDDLSNYIFNITPDEFRGRFVQRIADRFISGGNIVTVVAPSDVKVYDSETSLNADSESAVNAPAPTPSSDPLSYIYDINLWAPPDSSDGGLYELASAIDAEFNSILEKYNSNDFWRRGPHGFLIPNEQAIYALQDKMQKLTNLYTILSMINKGKINLVGIVKEEMEDTRGYQGIDTGKAISKTCQSAMQIVNKLTQDLLEWIQKRNEALYQHLVKKAHEHNDSCWDKFTDALTFGANTKKEIEGVRKATQSFMSAVSADRKMLESLVQKQSSGSDPTELDGSFAQLNQEIDKELEEKLGRVDTAVKHGKNGYIWTDGGALSNWRDDIVGTMNMMRTLLIIETSRRDFRSIVHEEMTGVSGRRSEQEAILQAYENKYASILTRYDRMAGEAKMYTQLYNQYVYLGKQLDKTGNWGKLFGSIGDFFKDLSTGNWSKLGEDIHDFGYYFPGCLNSFMRFQSTLFGWVPIFGSIYNAEAAAASKWTNDFYNDDIHIPASQYNPVDSRTYTGDAAYDALNGLNYQIDQKIRDANSNLVVTASDGLYQIDFVTAGMLLDMLSGLQNEKRLIIALDRQRQTARGIVHSEMTGVGSRESSQEVTSANEAQMQNQLGRFNDRLANLMDRKVAHNLEAEQELAIKRQIDQAVVNLWRVIPIIGDIPASLAELGLAENDPAYLMDLNTPPNAAYFAQKAKGSSGSTPEGKIEDDLNQLLFSIMRNGVISAGAGTSAVNPNYERRVKEEIKGLYNTMEILYLLGKAGAEMRDVVHREMTGVKLSTPGELSESALQADFEKVTMLIDYMIKWLEEEIDVSDRAKTAADTVDRLREFLPLTMFMTVAEIVLLFAGPPGWVAAVAIGVVEGAIRHVVTLMLEYQLLEKQKDYGELKNAMRIASASSDAAATVRDILDESDDDILVGINEGLIDDIGGGSSGVNQGYIARADRAIAGRYNIKRIIAQLYRELQEMRNLIHMEMAGAAGRTTGAARQAFDREEQVAKSIVDALFRGLERIAARGNMIHDAEIQYMTAVIQSWVSFAMAVATAGIQVKIHMKYGELNRARGELKAAKNELASLKKQLSTVTEKEKTTLDLKIKDAEVKVIDAEKALKTEHLQKMAKAEQRETLAVNFLSQSIGSLVAQVGELCREWSENKDHGKKVEPYEIKWSGRSESKEKGGKAEEASGSGWASQMTGLEDAAVNEEIAAANYQMETASIDAQSRIWMKLLKILFETLPASAANFVKTDLQVKINKSVIEQAKDFYWSAPNKDDYPTLKAAFEGNSRAMRKLFTNPKEIPDEVTPSKGAKGKAKNVVPQMKAYNVLSWMMDPIGTLAENDVSFFKYLDIQELDKRFIHKKVDDPSDPEKNPNAASDRTPSKQDEATVRNTIKAVAQMISEVDNKIQQRTKEMANANEGRKLELENEILQFQVVQKAMDEFCESLVSYQNTAVEQPTPQSAKAPIKSPAPAEAPAAQSAMPQARIAQMYNQIFPAALNANRPLTVELITKLYSKLLEMAELAAEYDKASPERKNEIIEEFKKSPILRTMAESGDIAGIKDLIGEQRAELLKNIQQLPDKELKSKCDRRIAEIIIKRDKRISRMAEENTWERIFGVFGKKKEKIEKKPQAQAKEKTPAAANNPSHLSVKELARREYEKIKKLIEV